MTHRDRRAPHDALRSSHWRLLPLEVDDERRTTVQPASLLAAVVVLRPLLAVADRAQPVGSDAPADQVIAHRVGAAIAERQVVLGRADIARMAFDLEPQRVV